MAKQQSIGACCVILGTLLFAGCGGGPPLGQVSGKITIDGKPIPDAKIIFQPNGLGRPSSAWTNEDGQYHLKYTAELNGALVGTHRVRISTEKVLDDEGKNVVPEQFPNSFHSESELEVEVQPGSNVFHFDPKQNPPITLGS